MYLGKQGRGVRVLLNILATAGAWENFYLVVVAVQGATKICLSGDRANCDNQVTLKCVVNKLVSS